MADGGWVDGHGQSCVTGGGAREVIGQHATVIRHVIAVRTSDGERGGRHAGIMAAVAQVGWWPVWQRHLLPLVADGGGTGCQDREGGRVARVHG